MPGRAVILLVEDQAVLRMLIEDVLSDAGHQVFSAPHARLALQLAREQNLKFDLLVTDVDMTEMSGLELFRCLVSASNSEIRVLYMSGHNVQDLLHSGKIDAGAAFLQKPFPPFALRAAIDELLQDS
jgi:CheY-like chemotaxis protein